MSSYTLNEIKAYATQAIDEILPLDEQTISQMVNYAITELRTREAVRQHFTNLLGESPKALDFITKLSNILFGDPNKLKIEKKLSQPSKNNTGWVNSATGSTLSKGQHDQRLRNASVQGTSTSELIDQTPKAAKEVSMKKKDAQKTLDSLKDLDAALNELEVSDETNRGESDRVVRVCNCNATRHPLFEMFPNCLNCGKIICAKEGFQPCSFCGKKLLNNEERLQIVEVLNREKEEIEGKSNKNERSNNQDDNMRRRKNVIKISINSTGQNNYKVQEMAFKRVERKRELERKKEELKQQKQEEVEEVQRELDYYSSLKDKDEELVRAQQQLDTLMDFQLHGAERTKIIDQASDFDAPTSSNNLWATPLERALQLKRQQKQLRKQQEADDRRSGRGKRVMDMSIRNGKVIIREVDAPTEIAEDLSDDEEIKGLQARVSDEKTKTLEENSHNVWDYQSDASKWTKPVYMGEKGTKENKELKQSDTVTAKSKVVQLGDEEEQENTIFSMVGV
ncbi:hypothetical protein FOA43_000205 [Brettanomyces nanus]|uniref:TRIP4/RQT4 C2HC5-type zinc finger domain-containing protein n=1 Tax=Eeniella nana TaxID=13502 RepID=A0A875RYB2_EENNA|nr:uncharacterized protein FOA43_000205 [Brettanomyces nanus]QPG72902.1 hypothetical protein FOA43_000205 [Brettanomyces nanus]